MPATAAYIEKRKRDDLNIQVHNTIFSKYLALPIATFPSFGGGRPALAFVPRLSCHPPPSYRIPRAGPRGIGQSFVPQNSVSPLPYAVAVA